MNNLKKQKARRLAQRIGLPIMCVGTVVFLLVSYLNLRMQRLPEGLITLAASVMTMVQAMALVICKRIDALDERWVCPNHTEPTTKTGQSHDLDELHDDSKDKHSGGGTAQQQVV